MKLKILNIFLVVLSMTTIFLFSCEKASQSNVTSRSITRTVVNRVVKNKSEKEITKIVKRSDVITRKIAHFTEYCILGLLVLNMLKDYIQIDKKTILIAIGFCLLYSISDELHQLFVSGRAGRVLDVIIDTFGSFIGTIIYYSIYKRLIKRTN